MDPVLVDATNAKKAARALVKHALAPQNLLVLTPSDTASIDHQVHRGLTQRRLPDSVLSHGLVVATSGSTGTPNLVCLENDALKSSADATHTYLGGPGRWVTALPLTHIAGIQTVFRSTFANQEPHLAISSHFQPKVFAAEAREAREQTPSSIPLYCSLVTAQLTTLLQHQPDALGHFDAILVGGGFVDESLIRATAALGVRAVTTYGMTETSGGCVYDGLPIAGTRVMMDEGGRLLISGPTLMAGYLDQETPWVHRDGTKWFATSDLGTVSRDGTVTVQGRNDDLIKSGGVKINLTSVAATCKMTGVREVYGFPVADERWGSAVGILVETALAPQEIGPRVAEAVREELGGPSTPKYVATTESMPKTALGKVDREAARALAMNKIGQGDAWHR